MAKGKVREDGKKAGCCAFLRTLSVEPPTLLLLMSLVMSHLVFQNLMMETICRVDLAYPEDMCKEIVLKVNVTYKAQEREIQKEAALLQAKISPISSIMSVFVVLFVGPWSDDNGRKIPLIASIVGMMSYTVMMIVGYLLLGQLSAIYLTLLVILPMTCTGGGPVFAMCAYSYLCDTTSPKNRTFRTGILSAAVRSGLPIGLAAGGLMIKFGMPTITFLLICTGICFTALILVIIFVENKIPGGANREDPANRRKVSCWKKYNPLYKLYQVLSVLFQKRKNRGTFYLLLLIHIMYAAPGSGEYGMLYLFVRERLQWNLSDFGLFSTYNWLMSAGGVVLSMFILSKRLKVSDPIVGFISGISQIAGSTIYAFANSPAMMFIASGVDMMNGTIGVVVRSMLSKIVHADDVGKLFSLLGAIETSIPAVVVPTYAFVYRNTVTTFAGAFFFLSAGVTVPAEFIFLYFMCRKERAQEESTEGAEANNKNETGEGNYDKVESALESFNRSIPDIARIVPNEAYTSRDHLDRADDEDQNDEKEKDDKIVEMQRLKS